MAKLSKSVIDKINSYDKSVKNVEIAEELGIHRNTVGRHRDKLAEVLSNKVDVKNTKEDLVEELWSTDYSKEIKENELRRSFTILKRKYRDLLEDKSASNKMEDVWQKTQAKWDVKIERKKDTTGSESTANIVLSDWHVEETIDPNTINGINEYNTEIAKQRAEKVFQNWLYLVDMMAKDEHIKNVNFALLWDFISWYIRPELIESNEMSPTEAILYAKDLITAWIDLFLNESDYDLSVVTAFWNHWRTTDRKRISTWWKNSYEWMLYVLIAQQYLDNDRVKFKIEKGYHNFQQQYDRMLRHHHWDGIRYQGWVWGIIIPLNKAIAQWNKVKSADYDVIWHWHQKRDIGNAIVNGSLIGYWPYAESIKADYEDPQQVLFLINDKFWKTITAPIFTE